MPPFLFLLSNPFLFLLSNLFLFLLSNLFLFLLSNLFLFLLSNLFLFLLSNLFLFLLSNPCIAVMVGGNETKGNLSKNQINKQLTHVSQLKQQKKQNDINWVKLKKVSSLKHILNQRGTKEKPVFLQNISGRLLLQNVLLVLLFFTT